MTFTADDPDESAKGGRLSERVGGEWTLTEYDHVDGGAVAAALEHESGEAVVRVAPTDGDEGHLGVLAIDQHGDTEHPDEIRVESTALERGPARTLAVALCSDGAERVAGGIEP